MSVDSSIKHQRRYPQSNPEQSYENIDSNIDQFWFQRFKSRHAVLLVYIKAELSPARIRSHYQLTLYEFSRVCSAILAAFRGSRGCIGENVGGIAVTSHFDQLTQSLLKAKHLPSGSNVTMYTPHDYMMMLKLNMTKAPTMVTLTVKPVKQWPASIQRQCATSDTLSNKPREWLSNMLWKHWCKIPGQAFFSSVIVTSYSTHIRGMLECAASDQNQNQNQNQPRPSRFVVLPIEETVKYPPSNSGCSQRVSDGDGDNNNIPRSGRIALDLCLCLVVDQFKCARNSVQPCELVPWLITFLRSKSDGHTSALLDTSTNEVYIYFRPLIECGAARVLPLQLSTTERQHFEVKLQHIGQAAVESCSTAGPCEKVFFRDFPVIHDGSSKLTATFVFHSGLLLPHIFLALLSCPVLDLASLRCNNPLLIEQTLGICAAHQALKMEVVDCMNYLNPAIRDEHANIIVSWMTQTGQLRSISHKGLSESSVGELQDCCFEQNAKSLNQSALNGTSSNLQNSSSRLMVGKMLAPFMEMEHTTKPH
jgi:hypothetical protein